MYWSLPSGRRRLSRSSRYFCFSASRVSTVVISDKVAIVSYCCNVARYARRHDPDCRGGHNVSVTESVGIEVSVASGSLRGTSAGGVRAFQGVPFAAPPVDALRFAAPSPVVPWKGVRDATRPGPACPQPVTPEGQPGAEFAQMFGTGGLPVDEDCLYLNVFTPDSASPSGPLPVMVFIHGGAFRIGTGSLSVYDGAPLAAREVVVVTINYRLGVLGFLNLPDVGPANVGLLDQIAALQWVRDNIDAFGGDPDNVTIFGESAGAKSVECLVASPRARGLFHRAIAESTYDPAMDHTPAIEAARRFTAALDATDAATLRRVPVAELIAEMNNQALSALASGGGFASALGGWAPVVDGDVLPYHPLEAYGNGTAASVPMIIGTTRDEAGLFTAMMPMLATLDASALPTMLGFVLGDTAGTDDLLAAYKASRGADVSPSEVFVAALTDQLFRQHSIRLAEAKAERGDPVWMYLFDWRSPARDGALGACHGLELPFVFGTLSSPLGALAGTGAAADALASAVQESWIAFATSGDPETPSLAWPQYDAKRRATAALGHVREVRGAPFDIERQAWAARSSASA
ncbi:MAG TPA: carboxylesterase family protein [Acidimicrobiales bacterium]|nr:carboxylesterase family protein [Acidimicrobiales bacterium]